MKTSIIASTLILGFAVVGVSLPSQAATLSVTDASSAEEVQISASSDHLLHRVVENRRGQINDSTPSFRNESPTNKIIGGDASETYVVTDPTRRDYGLEYEGRDPRDANSRNLFDLLFKS